MAKYKPHKSKFEPQNPQKYFGGDPDKITCRSSWELTMCMYFDRSPAVLGWSSETCAIPYRNPLTGRHTVYIPDFVVVYQDRNGKKHAEMIEVKPAKEVPGYLAESKLSQRDRLAQALNMAKWQAARAFCSKRGMFFRVMTEHQIYTTQKAGAKK